MWCSSEEPSKNTPHQVPSLNHSLLWVFAAVGPAGQGAVGLIGLCRLKATPLSNTSAPTLAISVVHILCLRTILVNHPLGVRSSVLSRLSKGMLLSPS